MELQQRLGAGGSIWTPAHIPSRLTRPEQGSQPYDHGIPSGHAPRLTATARFLRRCGAISQPRAPLVCLLAGFPPSNMHGISSIVSSICPALQAGPGTRQASESPVAGGPQARVGGAAQRGKAWEAAERFRPPVPPSLSLFRPPSLPLSSIAIHAQSGGGVCLSFIPPLFSLPPQ